MYACINLIYQCMLDVIATYRGVRISYQGASTQRTRRVRDAAVRTSMIAQTCAEVEPRSWARIFSCRTSIRVNFGNDRAEVDVAKVKPALKEARGG